MSSTLDMKRLTESFQPVASYKMKDEKALPPLASFQDVVKSISLGNRDSLLMKDIRQFMVDGDNPNERQEWGLQIMEGQHKLGMSLTIVAAEHDGKAVFMPVVIDHLTGATLIVGPDDLPSGAANLSDQSVQYVSTSNKHAPYLINQFIAEKTATRPGPVIVDTIGHLLYCATMLADMNSRKHFPTSVGDALTCIAEGEVNVVAFTAAAAKSGSKKPVPAGMTA